MQQLFAEWDAAAAAMAAAAHILIPHADVVDLDEYVAEQMEDEDHVTENEADGAALPADADPHGDAGLPIPNVGPHVGEPSGVGLDLSLNLGAAQPKRSNLFKNIDPSFVKRLEPTHITYGMVCPPFDLVLRYKLMKD